MLLSMTCSLVAPVIIIRQRRRVIREGVCQLLRKLFWVVVDQGVGELLEEGVLRVSWAHEPAMHFGCVQHMASDRATALV